jgi:lipid A 3-O-deacylase
MLKWFAYASLIFCSENTFSQNDTISQNKGVFTFAYENDLFTATDRYYTQGIKLEFIHPSLSKIPTQKTLWRPKKSFQKTFGINITQICNTPRSIRYDTLKVGERPFSASMFFSHFLVSNSSSENLRITSKIDLGIIGPCAVCEQEQKGIHKALNNIQPLGWEYQISTDVLLNYLIGFDKGLIVQPNMEFIALSRLRIGTLHNDIGLGCLLRFGKMNGYFNSYGLVGHRKKFQFTVYAKGLMSVVAYNGYLQGGIFSKDIYTLSSSEITRIVATMETGINISFQKFSFGYNRNWISPEFDQGIIHGWGGCNLSFGF